MGMLGQWDMTSSTFLKKQFWEVSLRNISNTEQ